MILEMDPHLRRVVITGLGCVSPLANGVEHSWRKIKNGQSGIDFIKGFDVSDIAVKIGGEVPVKIDDSVTADSKYFNVDLFVPQKEQKLMDKFIHFSQGALIQAVQDAGLDNVPEEMKDRIGVMIGSGIGGLNTLYETSITLHEKGPRRVSPYFIVSMLINLASGFGSIKYGFKGPNHATVTACASGTHAIGDAMRLIMMDDADIMIAGGAESALNRFGMAGFSACRALTSQFNDAPQKASRPWDKDRSGFVMGEGAGILVLEEYEHAKKRGAHIYAEIVGNGMSGDAYHYTAPVPDGDGAYRAMKAALRFAKLNPESVDYINAHGTSTPLGDGPEVEAVKRLFGEHAYKMGMSSTKSSTGHLLGAAGGIEAVFSVLAIRDGVMPPTLNLDSPDVGFDLNFVAHHAQEKKLNVVMSNSFGFGGTNACLIFKKI
jgi:3-oxoacyl-[acyl-carrier-protein] synthase II